MRSIKEDRSSNEELPERQQAFSWRGVSPKTTLAGRSKPLTLIKCHSLRGVFAVPARPALPPRLKTLDTC